MRDNQITGAIIDASYIVHSRLGPGLLESVYEVALQHELKLRRHDVMRQEPVPVRYGDLQFDIGFVADLIVDGRVIVELKSVERVQLVHKRQLLTYMRLTNIRLGLLLNFGVARIKDGITRFIR